MEEIRDEEIRQKSGRTIILHEYHLPENINLDNIMNVDTIGMSAEKVKDMQNKVTQVFKTTEDLVITCAFINMNGMSNLMQSPKYVTEINYIKELGRLNLKQSYLRIYWNLFKEINEIQLKKQGNINFYQRKALKFGIIGDYSKMHFSFDYDPNIMDNKEYGKLKNIVTSKIRQ